MGIALIGVNIPAPKVQIKKELLEKYADLYKGIRDRKDTVTWRTLVITIRELLGESLPDFNKTPKRLRLKARKLIRQLIEKTHFKNLASEIEYAVGVKKIGGRKEKDLDFLFLSGRHYPEGLLWSLADYAKKCGKRVAVVNPVGHYNDGQTRVVGPARLFRKVKKLVILASTQAKAGGSVSVLSNVIRVIRNENFICDVGEVDVVIPMFGGSRGHKLGQGEEVGFEIMEAGFNAKLLSLPAKDIIGKLREHKVRIPPVKFYSVDIHNAEYPEKVFREEGFEFISIDSSKALAEGIVSAIKVKKLERIPLKLIACDRGAVPRTKKLAERLLRMGKRKISSLQIIYIEKKRSTAGKVAEATVERIENYLKIGKRIMVRPGTFSGRPNFKNAVLVFSDDMIDTGGSAEKDIAFLSKYYPNISLKIFAASHPLFSKGFGAMKKMGADMFILGNSLNWDGLDERSNVTLVDFSESIYEALK